MKPFLLIMLLLQTDMPDCAAELKLRGVGRIAANQARPYANCLNAYIAKEKQLRSLCQNAGDNSINYGGAARDKIKVMSVVRWLDSMVLERANCETFLKVEA